MHNLIAGKITGYNKGLIDNVNKDVDAPVKTLGPNHRVLNHSLNPTREDSLAVTHGDAKREVLRRIHIAMDFSPRVNKLTKLLEMQMQLNKMKGKK